MGGVGRGDDGDEETKTYVSEALRCHIRVLRGEDWLTTRDTVCGAAAHFVVIRIIFDPHHFSLWKQQLAKQRQLLAVPVLVMVYR